MIFGESHVSFRRKSRPSQSHLKALLLELLVLHQVKMFSV